MLIFSIFLDTKIIEKTDILKPDLLHQSEEVQVYKERCGSDGLFQITHKLPVTSLLIL